MFYMWSQMLFSNDALTANVRRLSPDEEESNPDPVLALTRHQPLQRHGLFLAR